MEKTIELLIIIMLLASRGGTQTAARSCQFWLILQC